MSINAPVGLVIIIIVRRTRPTFLIDVLPHSVAAVRDNTGEGELMNPRPYTTTNRDDSSSSAPEPKKYLFIKIRNNNCYCCCLLLFFFFFYVEKSFRRTRARPQAPAMSCAQTSGEHFGFRPVPDGFFFFFFCLITTNGKTRQRAAQIAVFTFVRRHRRLIKRVYENKKKIKK